MQQREPPHALLDAQNAEGYILGMHWNHNVKLENHTRTVAAFTLNHDHEMSISAQGYYLPCSTVRKMLYISTILSNILFA